MPTLAHPPPWEEFPGTTDAPGITQRETRRLRGINWAARAKRAERNLILALSDAADHAQARIGAAYRHGHRHAAAAVTAFCPTHAEDTADAYAAGQRNAGAQAARGASAVEIGWNAAMTRFGAEIGSRSRATTGPSPAELRMWTRHHPTCAHNGGTVPCRDAGCLPGPRGDYGKRAPWDPTPEQIRDRAAASWATRQAAAS